MLEILEIIFGIGPTFREVALEIDQGDFVGGTYRTFLSDRIRTAAVARLGCASFVTNATTKSRHFLLLLLLFTFSF